MNFGAGEVKTSPGLKRAEQNQSKKEKKRYEK
jgi:hypothetical protein